MTIGESDHSWPVLLGDLLDRGAITPGSAQWAMDEVMAGRATAAQIAAFLVALRTVDVQPDVLAVLVDVMLQHSVTVSVDGPTVDTCGTGGDNSGSVNISTMAAVVVAATGRTVIKHGNRAASSRSGSADVLEALGVAVDLPPDAIAACVAEAGLAFCFAPVFHPAMRHAGPVRREIGVRSVFNVLGPLANPARPAAQVVGVADPAMAGVVAGALARRGTVALVVRGEDGMDEITTAAATRVWDARTGDVRPAFLDPRDLGIAAPEPGALAGGDAAENAAVARAVLSGSDGSRERAVRDAVAVNAAAAIVVYDTAAGRLAPEAPLLEVLAEPLELARSVMLSGEAATTLEVWAEVTRRLAGVPAES